MKSSCIRCDHYLRCKDPQKSIIYFCNRYKESHESMRQEKAVLEEILERPFRTSTVSHLPAIPSETALADTGFDAYEVLKSVLEDKRIVSPDIKIPEGDFPEAPNFYTWCVSERFLNQKPFIMQAWIGTQLFAEYCPRCSDMDWVENRMKVGDSLHKFERKVALLQHGKCPHCGITRLALFAKKLLNPYYELALSAGQRSGKSAEFGMLAAYLTHRMIKLERPNEVFGLLKANVLQGTFVALTHAQAKDTLWEPFYGHLLEAPWFQEYHAMLDHVQNSVGEDEIYKLKDTFVYYRHRRIQVYPAGPDKRVLRGRTRFLAGIDELGWFPNSIEASKNVKMNADEVYIALERSLLTVRTKSSQVVKSGFYNVPFGYFINISSPSSMRDKIMELVKKSQGSRRMLGMCLPTWKMNPHVPKSALAEEFRKDPIAAMRDYGAQPPLTNSPFISDKDKLEAVLSKKTHRLKINYANRKSKDKSSVELYGELVNVPTGMRPSILALDAGYSNNSFAFAIGHLRDTRPVISVVGEVIPEPGIRINHSLMYTHLLSKLVAPRNVALVCADRWNSLKILADMEQDHEIQKMQYSLKYVDMQLFKSYIEDQQVTLPRPSKPIAEILKYDHSQYPNCFRHLPADHLALQILTVQDTGNAVIKGDQLTDDILRAVMLCFSQLVNEDNQELLNGPDSEIQMMDITKFAVSRHLSGGGTSSMGGGGQNTMNPLGIIKSRG